MAEALGSVGSAFIEIVADFSKLESGFRSGTLKSAIDKATGGVNPDALEEARRSLNKFATDALNAGEQGAKGFGQMSASLKDVASGLGIYFGIREVAAVIGQMTRESLAFSQAMGNVNTLLVGSDVQVGTLRNQLLGLGGELGSSRQLADGLYEALSAGVEPAHAIEFVGTAAKLAKAELFDAGEATKLLATVMNAYGRETTDATHVSDVFVRTINVGIVRGNELAHALGNVIPTAAQAGISIEEVAAAVAIMTRTGIDADTATTSLNRAILSFIAPSSEAKKKAAELGIELSAQRLQQLGLRDAIQEVTHATKGDLEAQATLFGDIRGFRAALALTGAQAQDFAEILNKMKTSVGDTDEAFRRQQDNLATQWTNAWNNAQRLVDRFVGSNEGPLVNMLKLVNELLSKASTSPTMAGIFSIPTGGFYAAYVQAQKANADAKDAAAKALAEEQTRQDTRQYFEGQLGAKTGSLRSVLNELYGAPGGSSGASEYEKQIQSLEKSLRKTTEEQNALAAAVKYAEGKHISMAVVLDAFGPKLKEISADSYDLGRGINSTLAPLLAMQAELNATAKEHKEMDESAKQSWHDELKTLQMIEDATGVAYGNVGQFFNFVDDSMTETNRKLLAAAVHMRQFATEMDAIRNTSDRLVRSQQEHISQLPQLPTPQGEMAPPALSPVRIVTTSDWERWQRDGQQAIDQIVGDMSRMFTESIIHGKNFWEAFKGFGTNALTGVLDTITTKMLHSFLDPLSTGIGKLLDGMTSSLSGFLSGLGSKLGSLLGIGGGAAGTAVSAAGSAGSAGGSVSSAVSSVTSSLSGLAGAVNMVSGIASAVGSLIGAFGTMRLEGTMNAVEHNTRYSMIHLGVMIDQLFWPWDGLFHYIAETQGEHTNQLDAIYNVLANGSGTASGATASNGGVVIQIHEEINVVAPASSAGEIREAVIVAAETNREGFLEKLTAKIKEAWPGVITSPAAG